MFSLRSFVNERLTSAVEEILGAVEHTVVDYQKEVSRLTKEVVCLRRQLEEIQPVVKITLPKEADGGASVLSEDLLPPPDWQPSPAPLLNPSLENQGNPEPLPLKAEREEPASCAQDHPEPRERHDILKPSPIKVEEEHLDISEQLEADMLQLHLPPIAAFDPPFSLDCAMATTPGNGNSADIIGKLWQCHKEKDMGAQGDRMQPAPVHKRQYRARKGIDPGTTRPYVSRAAENQRKYRARRDVDPVRRQKYLEREKERWRENRRLGKRKVIGELSEEEQKKKREEWRAARLRSRSRQTDKPSQQTIISQNDYFQDTQGAFYSHRVLLPQAGHSQPIETNTLMHQSSYHC